MVIARVARQRAWARRLVVVAIVVLAGLDLAVHSLQLRNPIFYLPVFGVGVALALYEQPLVGAGRRLVSRALWIPVALIVLDAVLLSSGAEIYALRHAYPAPVVTFTPGTEVVGAALAVWLVLSWGRLDRALDRRPMQWVGKRSFSLYLTHEPLLIFLALALGGHPNAGELMLVVLPASLALSALFYRVVERPSHRPANTVGRRMLRRPLSGGEAGQSEPAVIDPIVAR